MQVGTIGGVQLKVHPTFFVMLAFYWVLGLGPQALLVFALVIGHETAHVLVGKAHGIRVKGLEIFPMGGVALCDDVFEGRKREEALMALAGPFFNAALLGTAEVLRRQGLWQGLWAADFIRYNFWLAVFNLLPVLPLDGGRVLRALLSGSFGFVKTTRFLARAGQWLGGGLAVLALTIWARSGLREGPLFFLFLAGFFWLAAGKEVATARLVFLRQLTHKKEDLVRKGLMPSRWLTVRREVPLVRVVEELTPDSYALVSLAGPEFDAAGTLTETEILEGMIREGIHYPVGKLYETR
ncbi:M50 family metallopeptidase [Acididesulfobacillus acetoxydans]|uniref:M50 family metallopeptidase n=1 Tax=Acididesulfobacillus acetoxydans TaxID=1561005 RepID=UPI001F0D69BA|nr:M50 family metallopeptidase [Acididesulfobacillus acetoxydans]